MKTIALYPRVGLVLSVENGVLTICDAGTGEVYQSADPVILCAEMPDCCWAEPTASAAERLYAAYNRGGPSSRAGLAWDGRPVPTWAELVARADSGDAGAAGVVAKWRAVSMQASRMTPIELGWG